MTGYKDIEPIGELSSERVPTSESINDRNTGLDSTSLLICKSVNDTIREAQLLPDPDQLFGTLWHEGELGIMFADTNLGKSLLAVQICNAVARGKQDKAFSDHDGPFLSCEAHTVGLVFGF